MILDNKQFEELRAAVTEATRNELLSLNKLRERVRNQIVMTKLGRRSLHTVAPVAADGGENNLAFEPASIEMIRVADSERTKHVELIIPLTTDPGTYERLFETVPVLSRMLDRLGIGYEDVSFLLPQRKTELENEERISSREYARIFRDIVEWAVLLDLAWTRNKLLLLRDGLLRTKSMKRETVKRLADSFEQCYHDRGNLLLGVAKRSKVLNYLSLALTFEKTFECDYACFCEVPEELEKDSYNWARTWQKGDQVFGRMHLVKLVPLRRGLVIPVDVPRWLMDNRTRKEALEYLVDTADCSFPIVGYPYPLVKAHEYAVLEGLDLEIVGSMVEQALVSFHSEEEKARVVEILRLGRGLQLGGWKDYGNVEG